MKSRDFQRLREGDVVLIRGYVNRLMLANEFEPEEPLFTELVEVDVQGSTFNLTPDEIMGVAVVAHPLHQNENDFIVGDRVRWCSHDGWFIVHLIPETSEAVILHDDAGRGCRRIALSRLERIAS